MNRNKELNEIVNRLERIFPHLEMKNEGHYFYDDKPSNYENCVPPIKLDWYDIIKNLNENGLEIRNKKD